MLRQFYSAKFFKFPGFFFLISALSFIYLFALGCSALTPVSATPTAQSSAALGSIPSFPQDCYLLAWGAEDYHELKAYYEKNRKIFKAPYAIFLAAQQGTDLGFSYLRLYKAAEAEAAFQKVLREYPTFARAQMGLGILQLKIHRNLPKAKELLAQALAPPFEATPEVLAYGHTNLAIIENLASATNGSDPQGPARAISHLQAALKLNPKSLVPYIYWGEILWNGGQYPKAAQVYRQATVKVPPANDPQYENWGWLALRLGQALYKAGQYKEAQEQFKSLARTIDSRGSSRTAPTTPPRLWQAMAQEMAKNLEVNPKDTKTSVLSVPHTPQLDSYCVPAATASVFEYYGEACSQEEVAQEANTLVNLDGGSRSKAGTLRKDIMDYARGRGFAAYNFCGTLGLARDLLKKGFPIIASLRYPSGAAHVLVLVGYDDRLGAFIVNDPATVKEDYYPYAYFSLLWGAAFNNSLLLVPQSKAEEIEELREGMIYCSSKDAVNQGDYYQSEGKPQEAREAYMAALKEDPRNLEALYKLALADIKEQNYTLARNHLEKAQEVVEQEGRCWEITWEDCEINPLRSSLDLALAHVLLRSGQKAEGEKLLKSAQAQNPYNMEVWYQRALTGDEEALALLLEYQPQKTQNHLLGGKKHYQEGKVKNAHKEFRKALRQNPQLAEGYYYLGLTEEKNKNLKEAQDCFTCAQNYAKDKWMKETLAVKLKTSPGPGVPEPASP